MRRARIIVGAVLIGGFVYMGLGAFNDTLTPYVSFNEARAKAGKNVQITGDLTAERTYWYGDDQQRTFHFIMVEQETGDSLYVAFDGVKPSTFDEATGIVAIGTYDGSQFMAKQVLTKCPSKYEGKDPNEHDKALGREKGDSAVGLSDTPR
jgi:cytochrome c-type biogenesis protein CcmE